MIQQRLTEALSQYKALQTVKAKEAVEKARREESIKEAAHALIRDRLKPGLKIVAEYLQQEGHTIMVTTHEESYHNVVTVDVCLVMRSPDYEHIRIALEVNGEAKTVYKADVEETVSFDAVTPEWLVGLVCSEIEERLEPNEA